MDYAIISLNNNQYLVKPGTKITILGEVGKVGDEISTATTLLVKDGDLKIGTPTLDYPLVFKVVEINKTDKIDIFTYKAKSRLRRHKGHRQLQSVLELVSQTKESKEVKAKPVTKTTKKAVTHDKTK